MSARRSSEPSLLFLVEKYLHSNINRTFVDVDEMIPVLQSQSFRFKRMKRQVFAAMVRKAYNEYCEQYRRETEEQERLNANMRPHEFQHVTPSAEDLHVMDSIASSSQISTMYKSNYNQTPINQSRHNNLNQTRPTLQRPSTSVEYNIDSDRGADNDSDNELEIVSVVESAHKRKHNEVIDLEDQTPSNVSGVITNSSTPIQHHRSALGSSNSVDSACTSQPLDRIEDRNPVPSPIIPQYTPHPRDRRPSTNSQNNYVPNPRYFPRQNRPFLHDNQRNNFEAPPSDPEACHRNKRRRHTSPSVIENGVNSGPNASNQILHKVPMPPHLKKPRIDIKSQRENKYSFENFLGNKKVLEEVCQLLLHLKHPEIHRHFGVKPPRGFILHGQPGVGKTLLASCIAGEINLPMLNLPATELVSGVSGESEKNIRQLFQHALEAAPCILFIDEVDSITPKRETAQREMERRIVSQLIACIDELDNKVNGDQVLIIGATNRLESIDPSLRRAGRFDQEIAIGIPDVSGRKEILMHMCQDLRLTPKFDFDKLAQVTPGYVGADLKALVSKAANEAVSRMLHTLSTTSESNAPANLGIKECSESSSIEKPKSIPGGTSSVIVDARNSNSTNNSNLPSTSESKSQTKKDDKNDDDDDVVVLEQEKDKTSVAFATDSAISSTVLIAANECDQPDKSTDIKVVAIDEPKQDANDSGRSGELVIVDVEEKDKSNHSNEESMDVDVETTPQETEKSDELPQEQNEDSAEPKANNITTSQKETLEENKRVETCDIESQVSDEISIVGQFTGPVKPALAAPSPIVERSAMKLIKDVLPLSSAELSDLYITMEDFESALKQVQPSSKREGFATVPDITWDDIGALKNIREELQVSILGPVKHAAEFKALGLNTPAGVLLCGPPGTGKTLLAKAVANEAGINFISVKGPELLNMYVGESERAVRQCFLRAKISSPCVIFFDELDSLCPRRSDSSDNGSASRVVNQLLTEMDGMESRQGVFIMAATNRPDIIDPAILRPGRLDKVLFVGFPNAEDRRDILVAITKNGSKPVLADDVDLEKIASCKGCENFTGADLASLVREASIAAFREFVLPTQMNEKTNLTNLKVYNRHFELALKKAKASVAPEDRAMYNVLKEKYSEAI